MKRQTDSWHRRGTVTQMESNGVTLEAIQGIMVKEIAKVQKEWQLYKQDILEA